MAAPQAIGPLTDAGVTMYYVPPPGQAPNIFTSFFAGFLKTRLPVAEQVFAMRLKALQPKDYSEAIADLEKTKGRYLSDMAKLSVDMQGMDSRERSAALQVIGAQGRAETAASSALEVERMKQEGLREKLTDLTEEQDRVIREGQQEIAMALSGGDVDEALAAYAGLRLALEDEVGVTPDQKSSVSSALAGIVDASGLREEAPRMGREDDLAQLDAAARVAFGDPPGPGRTAPVEVRGAGMSGSTRGALDQALGDYADSLGGRLASAGEPTEGGGMSVATGGRRMVPVPTPGADDPFVLGVDAQLKALREAHGKPGEVDFTAPIITKQRAAGFVDLWDSLSGRVGGERPQVDFALGAKRAAAEGAEPRRPPTALGRGIAAEQAGAAEGRGRLMRGAAREGVREPLPAELLSTPDLSAEEIDELRGLGVEVKQPKAKEPEKPPAKRVGTASEMIEEGLMDAPAWPARTTKAVTDEGRGLMLLLGLDPDAELTPEQLELARKRAAGVTGGPAR